MFCLLLRRDIIDLQDSLYQKFGIQGLMSRYSLDNFDEHFNLYVSKSIDYLRQHTNLTIPVDKNTTMTDLLEYVHNVISHPQDLNGTLDIPSEWNYTLQETNQRFDNYALSSFIPLKVKPYLVLSMSIFSSYDLAYLTNKLFDFLFKVNSSIVSIFLFSFSNIVAWLLTLSNFAFNVFLYFTIVVYFLHDGNDLVQLLFKVVPIDSDDKETIVKSLNQSIKGVFLSSIQLAVY